MTDIGRDEVFVYNMSGTYLGRWTLDTLNKDATGITHDPTGASDDLWVVDRADRVVYRYDGGTAWLSGTRTATDSFKLGLPNTTPEGIADPGSPPVANNDSYTTYRNQTLTRSFGYGVLTNDSDADGNPLDAIIQTHPAHGTLTLSWNEFSFNHNFLDHGSFKYTPAPGFAGTDTFTYKTYDGSLYSDEATVSIQVVNRTPTANNGSYSIGHDRTLTTTAGYVYGQPGGLYQYVNDPDGDALTYTLINNVQNGTLSLNSSNGSFIYTPNYHFTGAETFTYKVSDGVAESLVRTITINVVNNAPNAVNDSFSVLHDQVLTNKNVRTNDVDADGDALTTSLATNPAHGSATVSSTGQLTYTPAAGYFGSDSFTYQVTDGMAVRTATVTINVTNHVPVAVNDTYSVVHDHTLTTSGTYGYGQWGTGVYQNDSENDGEVRTHILVTNAQHGTLTFNSNGNFTYVPHAGYVGADTFTYKVSDPVSTGNTATVTINVTNQVPVANNDAYSVRHDRTLNQSATSYPYGILNNDTDQSGDPKIISFQSQPSHGSLTLNANGGFVYIPAAGYVGSDPFTYRITDGIATSNLATVTIQVTNSAPAANNSSYSILHDRTLATTAGYVYGQPTGLSQFVSDSDSDPITAYTLVGNVQHGTLTFNSSNGSFMYAPDFHYAGADTFTYKVSDGLAESAVRTITINVINNAPIAANDTFSVIHDRVLTQNVRANDWDQDGDALTVSLGSNVSHGALNLSSSGQFTYTPAAGYVGGDSFTYQLSDGITVRTATVNLT